MEKTKYLIIGNGIAGLSAVKEIRNNDKDGSIIIISSEPYLTYYRMKLTEGIAKDYSSDELLVNKESWYKEKNIKVILSKIVEKLNVESNTVILDDGIEIMYEKLLIATGSRPFIPPINGKFKEGVFALRTFNDLNYIKKYIKECDNVTVIGGGLLGLEAAWSLKLIGKKVNVIEFAPYLLPRQLDKELGDKLQYQLSQEGINIYTQRSVQEILGDGKVDGLKLSDGESVKTNAVLISSGIRPNLDLVRGTPIHFDKGIDVDQHLKTNIGNIYAAGDVAEFDSTIIGLWTTGNEQGKIAGANMSGNNLEYKQPKLFSSLRTGSIQIFSAGDIINSDNILEYKDEANNIHHKLFIKNGKLIGVILFGDLKEMNNLKNAVFNQTSLEDYLKTGLPFK